MNERYIKWYTPYLSCEFEMLVFGEKSGLPLILFPTSGARYYENKDFGLVGAVAWYIETAKSPSIARTQSISKVFIINRFTLPIGCAPQRV